MNFSREGTVMRKLVLSVLAALAFSAAAGSAGMAETVGKVGVDWTGNDIIIDAVQDPKIQGITCHVTYFDRSVIDRLRNGNWFEDPSNSSIACRQTGPVVIGDIDLDQSGEQVFKAGLSLIWKSLIVTRVYDKQNDTLIYLVHSRELVDGSAKMAISTVPLYGQNVIWTNGKPE
jgi:CreA protein